MKHKNRKRLLLCLCCALMVSALPATLTACDGDSSSGNVEAYDELGVYYCDVDGEEYLLTLNGNRFTLFVGDETKYGAYTYEGTELNLLFAGEAKTQVASLTNDGVATLTVNGNSYRFLRKTNYTVSYESNGGSSVAAASVVNGKTLAKPADPVKAGYNFVGWYTDAEFTTPFVFDSTLVTGDLKLYARYAEKDAAQNEYVVTFVVDGNVYATKKTVSGKVFDLPTPKKDGATFAGWWTSDAQDAAKLTCKYEGQVLGESAKLFAVWASDAPLVSVDKTGVRWTASGVNNSYTVKITAPSEADNVTQTLGDSSLSYDFASKGAGEYVVEVTLGEKTTKVYYNNKQLDAVSNFSVVEPSVLVFNGVANAEKYLVTVDCGNDKHTHTEFNNGTSLYFNFGNCDMQKGGIKFTVKAVANGYMTSESAEFSFTRELDNVTGLSFDAAKAQVSWNKVDNALSYVVEIKKGDTTTKVNVGTATYYSLKEYSGELTVKVYPVAAGFNSPEGVSETWTKATLATPSNIHLEGKKLVWTAVEGATKYLVKIGATEITATTNECDLSDLAYAAEYQISVQAIGEAEDKNSLYSDVLTVKSNIMVDAPVYDKGVVSWTPVLDADSYGVRVNGGAVTKVEGTKTSFEVTLTKAGVNTIEVCSYYRNQVITDYVAVEVFAYEIEFDTRGGSTVDSIFKAIGDKVVYPTNATYEGYIFAGWYNVPGGPKNSGEQYKDGYYTNSGNTVMYAYWTPQDYEVTLTVNEEEGTIDKTKGTVYYKEEYTLPIATSKDQTRTFGGWYTGPNGGGTQCTDPLGNSVGEWNTAAGLQLYAYWIDIFTFNSIDNGASYSVSKGSGINYVTEITIPATYNNKPVTTVEGSAFASCSKLKRINMPDTIQLVAIPVDGGNGTGSPFQGCTYLEWVEVYCADSDNHNRHEVKYSSADGVLLYHEAGEVQIKYVPYRKRGTFEIPEGVTTIPINAFKGSYLSEVVIPASVVRIDETAFTVQYSSSTSYLTSVVFKPAAEGVKEQPLTIAKNAFRYCNQLTSVTLPARLVDFNIDIFANCTKLAKIFIQGNPAGTDEPLYASTDDGVLTNADGDTIVYVPKGRTGEYTIPKGITAIGAGAFQDCKGLTKVTIPSWVQTIDANAFRNCTYLREVVFEGVASDMPLGIKQYAFYGCISLTKLELPENLALLEKHAFGGTSNLTEVKVTGANMELENVAFGTNSEAPEYYVTDLFIGKNVKEFEVTGVFGGETLARVEVEEGNQNYVTTADGVLFNADKSTIVYFPSSITGEYTVIDDVKTIGAEVFRNKYITKVIIGKNVTSIGEGAFMDCKVLETVEFKDGTADLEIAKNAFLNCASIKAIDLPDRLVSLGDYAFAGTNLTTVEIPEKTTVLGTSPATVFEGCEPFTNITVDPDNTAYAAIDGILYGKVQGVITSLYFAPALNGGNNGVVDIPKTVTTIGDKAFYGNKNITEIKFSQGVDGAISFGTDVFTGVEKLAIVNLPVGFTKISAGMFKGITSLTTVIVPYTVTNIEKEAFSGCTNLSLVRFDPAPSGTTAPALSFDDCGGTTRGHFYNCTSLTTLDIPARTNYLGSYTFGYAYIKSVTIPKSVTTLGSSLFYCSAGVETITFEEGSTITALPDRAFYYCKALTTINNLPNTITNFGDTGTGSAFSNTAITSITIPKGVTAIGSSTFSGCKQLETVTFEEGGTENLKIKGSAFYGCSALKYVKIPARTVSIGTSAFSGCSALGTDPAKSKGVEFETGSRLEELGVTTSTGSGVFKNCTGLTEFTFPETIKIVTDADSGATSTVAGALKLGAEMFYGCTNLTKVHISSTVTDLNQAFLNSTTITNITVSPDNKNIKYDAEKKMFTNFATDSQTNETYVDSYLYAYGTMSDKLVDSEGTLTIPDGVKLIGARAFYNKSQIKKVSFPASLETISDYAFNGCSNLATIEFRGTSSLKTIGTYAFASTGLVSVTLPNTVATMGSSAFRQCASLQSINVSTGITTIPAYAFYQCTSLASFTVPAHVTKIDASAFHGCTKLETIDLHNGIESIGGAVFQGCTKLNNVTLPDNTSYTTINNNLFNGCTGLKSITIPASVVNIGASLTTGATFKGCSNLETVTFAGDNVTSIMAYSFQNCTGLKNFEMPGSLTTLGRSAFNACTSLKSITLPVGLTELDEFKRNTANPNGEGRQFQGCTSLETVTINGAMSKITGYLFDGCTSLKTISIPDSVSALDEYAFRNTGFESITLPQLLRIETNVFSGAKKLSSVTLYEEQRVLGKYMFADCVALEAIVLPDALVAIPDYAFARSGLKSLQIPERVTEIGDAAFLDCKSLSQVNLEEGVKSIGARAFSGSDVRAITLPASVQTLGGAAFFGCANLGDMSVSSSNVVYTMDAEGTLWADNMKKIVTFSPTAVLEGGVLTLTEGMSFAPYAFYGCTNIKKLVLPASLKEIPEYAFYGCTALREVEFGASLEYIGDYAFYGCSSLEAANLPVATTWVAASAFQKSGIRSLSFPGIKYIESYAFAETEISGELVIPASFAGMSSYNGSYAFKDCTEITSVILEGVDGSQTTSSIGMGAFEGCSKLRSVVIGEGFTSGGQNTFKNCVLLDSIDIPSTLTQFYDRVFENTGFTEFVFPATVKTHAPYLFSGCTKLERVEFAEGTTQIGGYGPPGGTNMFQGCTALKEVVFPSTMTSLVGNMFNAASGYESPKNIKKLIIPANMTSVNADAFKGLAEDCQVYCRGSQDALASLWTSGWNAHLTLPVIWDYTGN